MQRVKQMPLSVVDRVKHRVEIRKLRGSPPIGQPGDAIETEMFERFRRTFEDKLC